MHNICFCFHFCNLHLHNGIFKSQKGNRVLLYRGYEYLHYRFQMELLFGDADITGLLNAFES